MLWLLIEHADNTNLLRWLISLVVTNSRTIRLKWCWPWDIDPPDGNTTLFVNRWLYGQSIEQTQLLACDYHEETIFLTITNWKLDGNGKSNDFEAFRDSEKACKIKELLQVGEVEFVTVANLYDRLG